MSLLPRIAVALLTVCAMALITAFSSPVAAQAADSETPSIHGPVSSDAPSTTVLFADQAAFESESEDFDDSLDSEADEVSLGDDLLSRHFPLNAAPSYEAAFDAYRGRVRGSPDKPPPEL